jgi:hypothetical protein
MFEHLIELPDRRPFLFETLTRWAPPLLITVDDVRYIAVPTMTTGDARKPWRYVAY